MVNINNFSVGRVINPNELVSKPVQNNASTVENTPTPQYNKDAVSVDNTKKTGPVPDVKLGWMDKISTKFKDVYQSDDNVKKFVVFQKAMETNPAGYLEAGSTDTTKVNDLQQKLKLMGYSITVNGKFGEATEKAVVDFKKSVGINDGFLNKNAQLSVSSIVTPETWRVLNSNVSVRLNPAQNITQGTYIPSVTQDEMNWAKDLSNKVSKFGYPPSKEESTRYNSIRQRMNQANEVRANLGISQQNPTNAPTAGELDWAKNFLSAVKQGHKPTAIETQKYNDIRAKQQTAKNQPTPTQQGITAEDLAWAKDLANKVRGGYDPKPEEADRYNKIVEASKNQPTQTQQGVTPEDLAWAKDLANKVRGGYDPKPEEADRYNKIVEASKNQPTQATEKVEDKPVAKDGPVSKEELDWALDFQDRVNNKKYEPSQEEVDKFNNILERSQKYAEPESTEKKPETDATQKPETTDEVVAPTKVENKDKNHGNTVEVFGKVGSAMNDWNKAHPKKPFPRDNVFYAAVGGNLVSQLVVNEAAKQGSDYVSKLGLVGAKAIYAPNLSANDSDKYAFANGKIYNKEIVDNTVDLRVDNNPAKTEGTGKKQPKAKPVKQEEVADTAPVKNTNPPNDEELLWAKALEDKVTAEKYEPSAEEMAKYDDIFARAQNSSGAPKKTTAPAVDMTQVPDGPTKSEATNTVSVEPDPNNQELTWALGLLDKIQAGYTPKQEEIDAYEKIVSSVATVPYKP